MATWFYGEDRAHLQFALFEMRDKLRRALDRIFAGDAWFPDSAGHEVRELRLSPESGRLYQLLPPPPTDPPRLDWLLDRWLIRLEPLLMAHGPIARCALESFPRWFVQEHGHQRFHHPACGAKSRELQAQRESSSGTVD